MQTTYDIELEGTDRVYAALRDVQPSVREKTVPVMEKWAERIAEGARGRAVPHPSGLWSSGRGQSLAPDYREKKRGSYLFSVETPGTAAGKAEAISEFARLAVTDRGAAMVRALDAAYGRGGGAGGGRILWAEYDDDEDALIADIDEAVDAAAGKIDEEMG